MDRSFSILDRNRLLAIAACVILAVAATMILSLIGDTTSEKIIVSTYATSLLVLVTIVSLIANEMYSKWNSFVIASGTDRTDFIRTRFVKLVLINSVGAALFTCLDIVRIGANDNSIALLAFNISLAAMVTSVFLYIICRMGATIRSDLQMTAILIPIIFVITIGSSIGNNIMFDSVIDLTSYAFLLATSVLITVIGYFACIRRIKRVDM